MGFGFICAPLVSGLRECGNAEIFSFFVPLLSKKRKAGALKAQQKAMKIIAEPVAIFSQHPVSYLDTENRSYLWTEYRLCGIYELCDLPDAMAKLVVKNASKKKCRVTVHAKDEKYAKRIKKKLKKAGKKAKVDFCAENSDAVLVFVSA